ncbi:hypothetical protein [Anaerovirgula multivorans]|uniref:hypothetical protein n=1 Tax=Anaerovirgula multivorans TaxID=312168 RepID=UPI001A9A5D57|nr:hypothetical protein [Anaerovirgula multivorans]
MTVLRYIYQNPMKAEITNSAAKYRWSSYHEYKKDKVLRDLKATNGITIRQLAKVTGVSKYTVEKV